VLEGDRSYVAQVDQRLDAIRQRLFSARTEVLNVLNVRRTTDHLIHQPLDQSPDTEDSSNAYES